MTAPEKIVTERLRSQIAKEGIDLKDRPELVDELVKAEILATEWAELQEESPEDLPEVYRRSKAALTGFGPLQPFFDDPEVEEIWINSPSRIFIAKHGQPQLTNLVLSKEQVDDLVDRMLYQADRRVDLSNPFADGKLADGSRIHVVLGSITGADTSVNIRKFVPGINSLGKLVELEAFSAECAVFLRKAVQAGLNILVSGPTHSGKTTLLRSLLAEVRPQERIITVEETHELNLDHADVVALQCRQAGLEGGGEITLRRLVKESLRMRPDRLVVGEVREAESLDLLIALNSGVAGMCSVHANSVTDALRKMVTLPLLAGKNIDSAFIQPTVASCINLVVQLSINANGERRVTEIAAVRPELSQEGTMLSDTLFALKQRTLEARPLPAYLATVLAEAGQGELGAEGGR